MQTTDAPNVFGLPVRLDDRLPDGVMLLNADTPYEWPKPPQHTASLHDDAQATCRAIAAHRTARPVKAAAPLPPVVTIPSLLVAEYATALHAAFPTVEDLDDLLTSRYPDAFLDRLDDLLGHVR